MQKYQTQWLARQLLPLFSLFSSSGAGRVTAANPFHPSPGDELLDEHEPMDSNKELNCLAYEDELAIGPVSIVAVIYALAHDYMTVKRSTTLPIEALLTGIQSAYSQVVLA